MIVRIALILFLLIIQCAETKAQCGSSINIFPYNEGFEASDGSWTPGGSGSDWAWGTPSKATISTAGGGTKSWIVGGLTASGYTNSEASWLQSPCFDFTTLANPYIEFKVLWEMEQRFDGASLQYSIDNGSSWETLGSSSNTVHCYNENWYNNSSITYLAPLTANKTGWSGNIQTGSGSCNGGSGSGKWVTAKQSMNFLAGEPNVIFRFLFGAGTICNNYDGFAIDDFEIKEAPLYYASYTYTCSADNVVTFRNTSPPCLTILNWSFGDPASGANNTATGNNPSHTFSAPGLYSVTLNASYPTSSASTFTDQINVVNVKVTMLAKADCDNNTGGSLQAEVNGMTVGPISYIWNSMPAQTMATATNLSAGDYIVTVSGSNFCTVTGKGKVETDFSCIGVFFPTGFTPDNNGKNDGFGPLGSLMALSNYKLTVYNRWGQIVFTSINPFEKWYGKVKGLDTDSNIFIWRAEYSFLDQPKQYRKGTVMLIR